MHILQVIGTLDPAYGGPVEGLIHQTGILRDLGHTVEVVTLDAPTEPWIKNVPFSHCALGPSWGRSYCYNTRLVRWLQLHGHHYDVIVVHGIWQWHSFAVWRAARRLGVPYVLYPHGALDPWFKRAYPLKHLKKWLYWPWAEYRVLRDASAVLFTTEEECQLARKSFWLYKVKGQVVGTGISAHMGNPDIERAIFRDAHPNLREKRILLFLSRIHQKKGCDLLIEAFSRIAECDSLLHLVIAGPDQEGWQPKLEALARARGVSDRITWPGMLSGEMKWGAIQVAEALVLPSHSENFGIVVAEALACGVPVLISDKVNIWREIVLDEAGLVAPDTLEGTTTALVGWLAKSPEEVHRMSRAAKSCFESRFEAHVAAKNLIRVVEAIARESVGRAEK